MPITLVGAPQTGVNFETSANLSYTAGAGSNRVVVVAGGGIAGGSPRTLTATYGGTGMTETQVTTTGSSFGFPFTARILEADIATLESGGMPRDFAASWSAAMTHDGLGVAFTLAGVDQDSVSAGFVANALAGVTTSTFSALDCPAGSFSYVLVAHSRDATISLSDVSDWSEMYQSGLTGLRVAVFYKLHSTEALAQTPTVSWTGGASGRAFFGVYTPAAGASAAVSKLALLGVG